MSYFVKYFSNKYELVITHFGIPNMFHWLIPQAVSDPDICDITNRKYWNWYDVPDGEEYGKIVVEVGNHPV